MTIFVLAILLVSGYGLFQLIYQRRAHDQLEADRRRRYAHMYS
jgi:type II secretory pathway component PulL